MSNVRQPTVSFRPIREDDQDLLYRIFASTRAGDMSLVDWSDQQKEEFLRMQFRAQHVHYQKHYAAARFDVVLRDGEPVGRLYVEQREDEVRIVDIAILPEFQGAGIGGGILRDLLEQAREVSKPVRIHVERNNPALRLYERLGFQQIGDGGVYYLLEWNEDRLPEERETGGVGMPVARRTAC